MTEVKEICFCRRISNRYGTFHRLSCLEGIHISNGTGSKKSLYHEAGRHSDVNELLMGSHLRAS